MATFAEVLSLLIRQGIPLREALVLAGRASGDQTLYQGTLNLADRLVAGHVVTADEARRLGFPPLLAWLLTASPARNQLSRTFSQVARRYRDEAAREASLTAQFVPILVTALIGGGATLAVGLSLLWPVARLMFHLGMPT
jgi:type II secretory pathway component PulF